MASVPVGSATNWTWSAVGTSEIADAAVTAAKIAAGAVGSSQLADLSVGTTKIADAAVTGTKIAAGAVGASQLADGSVGTAKLVDGAVTTIKIAAGAVTSDKLAERYIKIASGSTLPATSGYSEGNCFLVNPASGASKLYVLLENSAAAMEWVQVAVAT